MNGLLGLTVSMSVKVDAFDTLDRQLVSGWHSVFHRIS